MFKVLKNEKGWAMTLVVILAVVVPVLGLALYYYSDSALKIVTVNRNIQIARYMARSGIEAVKKVWMDADIDEKPVGNVERIYYMKDNTFKLNSELTENQKNNESQGYIDVKVEKITSTGSIYYGSTVITATSKTPHTQYVMKATSIPLVSGQEAGWYNTNSNVLNTGPNTLSKKIKDGYYNFGFFNLQGIVVSDTRNNTSLILPENAKIGVTADSIYFKDIIDAEKNANKKNILNALFISAKTIVFEEKIRMVTSTTSHSTVILHVPQANAVSVPGKEGLYGMAYFRDDVILYDSDTKLSTKIIDAGTSFYYKSKEDGVDLITWYKETAGVGNDDMFRIPLGDTNRVVPTVEISIYFIYN